MPKFPYPVYFYVPEWTYARYDGDTRPASGDEPWPGFTIGIHIWTTKTALYFTSVPNVHLTSTLPDHGVIIAHNDAGLRGHPNPDRVFFINVVADREAKAEADLNIVQNQVSLTAPNSLFIPHWTQHGITPRAPERGEELKTLSYKGNPQNLDSRFLSESFRTELKNLGIDFLVETDPATWSDYSYVDAFLAVRPGDVDLNTKPATKLQNCWEAGVIPLLGSEPAYEELRQGEYDFLLTPDPSDVIYALRRLRENPAEIGRFLTAGRQRRAAFNDDTILAAWRDMLERHAFPGLALKRHGSPVHQAWLYHRYPARLMAHNAISHVRIKAGAWKRRFL